MTAKNITITSLAGGVSGALEILFTYPFEFAKTQQQLEPKKYSGKPFWVCWKDSYREFGGFPKGFTGECFILSGYFVSVSITYHGHVMDRHLSWNASSYSLWCPP